MKNNEQCTWAVNNFPRGLKDRYAAWLKANRVTIRDHLEYLIAKTMREAGVSIPEVDVKEIVSRIKERAQR